MSAAHPFQERQGAYAAKGLAIRVGDDGQAAVLFDRGLLQMSAAWSDGYLDIPDRRFGLIQHGLRRRLDRRGVG